MRAAGLPLLVGVSTISRTKRAPVPANVWVVVLAVLPRTCATVAKVVPSVDTCTSKSRVFHPVFSPPAPAWETTTRPTVTADCRSTRHDFVLPSEHHLSAAPPDTLPLTAFSGPSLGAHELS